MVYFTTKREGYREYKSREYLCKTYPTRRMCTENAKCEKTVLRHVWQDYVEMAEHVRYIPVYAPSGLLRADNSSKPSYRELQRLIHEEGTSQGDLHTDENGVAELAGFRGTYSLHTDRAQAEVQLTAQPITQPRRILLQDYHT